MLKKEKKKHWKWVCTWESIQVLWLWSQPRLPLGHEVRSCAALNDRPNSRDSATFIFVTRVIVYVVWFCLSYIYLSLVLRRLVLIKGHYIFGHTLITLFCQENVGTPIWHKNIWKLCWSESLKGRKTGPRQRYPFSGAGKVRIGNSCICL